PERPALVGLRRSAVAAVSVVGLWATVAASDDGGSFGGEGGWCETGTEDEDDSDEGGWQDVEGQAYIHNHNVFANRLQTRTLRPEVVIDCDAIASDPGRLLPDEAFGEAVHWELPPTTNVGVMMPFSCGAAKIAGEGIPEQIVFSPELGWVQSFPGSHEQVEELWSTGAAIRIDPSGATWIGGASWRHTPRTDS